jgi:hypothetical protein
MTSEQKERLAELRKGFDIWRKQQKLNKFKGLPEHLRQEIVDEAIINDMALKIQDVQDSDFPGHQELANLTSIKVSSGIFDSIDINFSASFTGYNASIITTTKYYAITSLFTKDELMNAHMEASIEEQINN